MATVVRLGTDKQHGKEWFMQGVTTMTDRPMELRLQCWRVDPNCLLTYLRRYDEWPDCIGVTLCKGPPVGSRLEEVFYDWQCRAFYVIVSHQDFPLVHDGDMIPRVNAALEVGINYLVRGEDGAYRPSEQRQASESLRVDVSVYQDTPCIVMSAKIEQGDRDAACETLLRNSLGNAQLKHITCEAGYMVARIPLPRNFFGKICDFAMAEFVFNDGVVCPTCKRSNIPSLLQASTTNLVSLRDQITAILYDRERSRC